MIAAGYRVWKEAKTTAEQSCLLSLNTALIKSVENDEALRAAVNAGSEWRVLSDGETQLLFESLGDQNRFDCANHPDYTAGRDEPGARLRIAARRNADRIFITIEGTGIYQKPFVSPAAIK
ncbi:MAG: hypothetical protein JSS81_28680 [Acidobacteria bacterium]|nr:hypothetical protein [Acidobacteriota bacterium]